MTSWNAPNPKVAPGWNQPQQVQTPAQIAAAVQADENPYAKWTNDQVLVAWEQSKTILENAKATEMALRKEAAGRLVQNPRVGTNNVELGNGFVAKVVHKVNYNFVKNEEGTRIDLKRIEAVQEAIEGIGNVGPVLADRLIDWKPEFSLSEFNKLDPENEDEAKIKKLMESILVVTDAAPTLEIKAPKAK